MIRLAAIASLTAATPSLAVGPGHIAMHTNQGQLVRHSNQESNWTGLVTHPAPLSGVRMDPAAFDLLGDPWSHGNSPRMPRLPDTPRMTTPQVRSIPAPGTWMVLGLAGLRPARRRRRRLNGF